MAESSVLEREAEVAEERHHHDEHVHGHDACECGHEHHHDHHHEHHHDHDHCDCGCDHDHDDQPQHELHGQPSFTYHVLGIDCPNCASGTQNAVRALPCVEDAQLVYATATLSVVAEENVTVDECKRQVLACVRSCGQDLELTDEERTSLEAERPWWVERREQLLMGASGTLLCLGLVAELLLKQLPVAIPLYVLAAVAGLVFIAPTALASLRRRTADMNVLMGIAVIGGRAIGFQGCNEG